MKRPDRKDYVGKGTKNRLIADLELYIEYLEKVTSDKILPKCTRVEVIDTTGRAYVNWQEGNIVQLMMQDDDRTLKIFISSKI